jgi:hypothetical protein
VRLRFKGKTPAWAPILTGLFLINICVQVVAAYWIPHWAPIQPDLTHSYRIQFRGGPPYFVQPWLGAFSDYGYYAGFALVVLFLLLLWLNRDKVERLR